MPEAAANNVEHATERNESDSTVVSPASGGSGSKKKSTFVPLFSSKGQERTVAMLPGI